MTRLLMAALSLTLTAGFPNAPQDEATMGATPSGHSASPIAVAPSGADTVGNTAASSLFAPVLNALAARRNKVSSHALLRATARHGSTAGQLTYDWGFSPPAPILPFTP